MASADGAKKINKVIKKDPPLQENAGERNSNGIDTTTCFGIPGSGLPRRHCNVNINITAAVASDLTVYLSVHDGKIYQNVFGRKYNCKLFTCPYNFSLYIPRGVNNWDGARFKVGEKTYKLGQDGCDVRCINEGRVEKTYDKSVPFEWIFGSCVQLTEKEEYYESEILKDKWTTTPGNGGFSKANSHFVDMGKLTDYGWKKEQGSGADGVIYLCGGILYDNSTITSDIEAQAVPVTIPGLNLANFYYPGDIQKSNVRMSLNRPDGYLRIYKPSRTAEYLDEEDGWRDIKNTENDKAVKEGYFENWGFRRQGNKWVRLIITGEGIENDEESGGIGSVDNDVSSSSTAGGCCYCTRGASS